MSDNENDMVKIQEQLANESETEYEYQDVSTETCADAQPADVQRTSVRADPFAIRAGHSFAWKNVNMEVSTKDRRTKSNVTTQLLKNVSGSVQPCELCCIMGASGAGKSLLLNVLSGKIKVGPNVSVESQLFIDGKPFDPTLQKDERRVAFVGQRDSLLATATPREAIRFSARMRLSREVTEQDIDELTEKILSLLELTDVADFPTGSAETTECLSGGERRRLSFGIELVIHPTMLLLGEATSGLDSHSVVGVVKACKQVASSGAIVIMTIHQPSSEAFELMDHLVLFHHGRCLYQGAARSAARYFEEHGYHVPTNYNPAEWILKTIQTVEEDKLEESGLLFDDCALYEGLESQTFSETDLVSVASTGQKHARIDWKRKIKELLARDLTDLQRDCNGALLRLRAITFGAAFIGICFQGVGSNSHESITSLLSHAGAIFFVTYVVILEIQLSILDVAAGRGLFLREFQNDYIRMLSYGVTKLVFEIVTVAIHVLILTLITFWAFGLVGRFWYWYLTLFLFGCVCTSIGTAIGSAVSDPRNARELIPVCLLPHMLLDGFIVNCECQ